jgi:hypothetical protein
MTLTPEVQTKIIKPDHFDPTDTGAIVQTTCNRVFDNHYRITEQDDQELERIFVDLMN